MKLWRGRPNLDPADPEAHSLQELAIQSPGLDQIVEIGWTVDRSLNGDIAPHLFVFHWVDGEPTCYNGCGFVQTPTRIVPGMELPSGGFSTFQIEHNDVDRRWEFSLDGTMFGYFPDSLWSGSSDPDWGTTFRLRFFQTFGEVASITSSPPCNQMGTGKFAESPASSAISGFTLLGPTPTEEDLFMPGFLLQTTPEWYNIDRVTPTGFWLGGPGAGRARSAENRARGGASGAKTAPLAPATWTAYRALRSAIGCNPRQRFSPG